jgi:glycosyltransferase involved in cell wall biosynthesis
MISVIIPTLNTPTALDLCLKSAIDGQQQQNEIIVVVDGDFNTNKEVLSKYSLYIKPLILDKNVGTCKATNFGVYNAMHKSLLIVNDDNVFPSGWDQILSKLDLSNAVVAPNQIEPYNSIFRQFHIRDLGRDPASFDLEKFWQYELSIRKNMIEYTGSTFPILIDKFNYLRCGGFDSDYPSPSGFVADWEFFMKCEMNGLKMIRTYQCMFYHFVSVTAKTPEKMIAAQKFEQDCHAYFKYKWGSLAKHNPQNNSKLLKDN